MPPSTTLPRSLTDSLIALKSQYEQALTNTDTKAILLREQLSHVNALLLNQLVPTKAHIKSAEPALILEEADAQVERLALASAVIEAPASDTPKASTRKPKATAEPALASGKRSTRQLLPAYRGLKRLEAIAQLLQATPGQDLTAAQVSEGLFGELSAVDHKSERKSLNTQLYRGQSLNLWQKGTVPGTFTIGAPTPSESNQPTSKAPATKAKSSVATASKRKSLTLLPAYAELTKREAIAKILVQYLGEALHQDTIIQTLYGDLSPEDLKEERVRIKTVLFTGVKNGKWQKASVPSSYFLEAAAGDAKPKRPGRNPKEPTPQPEPVAEAAITPASDAAKAKAAKPKPGRKPAMAKAKAPQKVARSKKTELELVELLRKADIQV
jgi:hypothetical protein